MNWLDIGILVFCGILGLIGLGIGLIRIAFSLAGLVLGVYLAGHYYVELGEKLTFISDPGLAKIAGFLIIFFAIMLVAAILASLVSKMLKVVLLGWVDKLGGFIGGVFFGGITCAALLAIIAKYTSLGVDSFVAQSQVTTFIVERFPLLLGILPQEFDSVRNFFG